MVKPSPKNSKTKKQKANVAIQPAGKKIVKRRTIKAGLSVPVPVVSKFIRLNYASRVSGDSDIAMAACLEAIVGPIILSAADEAGDKSILLANDVERARIKHSWSRRIIPGGVGAVFVKRPQ